MDDICMYSPSDIPNDIQIHANIIEFMLWATTRWGFKIGPDKFSPFVRNFKFLGHFFRVDEAITTIPPARLEAIKSFRVPRSCAETLSRISVISYHRRYVPTANANGNVGELQMGGNSSESLESTFVDYWTGICQPCH